MRMCCKERYTTATSTGKGYIILFFDSLFNPFLLVFPLQVGLDIPLLACKHAYVTTDRIPGIENMPNIR